MGWACYLQQDPWCVRAHCQLPAWYGKVVPMRVIYLHSLHLKVYSQTLSQVAPALLLLTTLINFGFPCGPRIQLPGCQAEFTVTAICHSPSFLGPGTPLGLITWTPLIYFLSVDTWQPLCMQTPREASGSHVQHDRDSCDNTHLRLAHSQLCPCSRAKGLFVYRCCCFVCMMWKGGGAGMPWLTGGGQRTQS